MDKEREERARRALALSMREALRTSGLSANSICRQCGVSQSTMSNYLAGKRSPGFIFVARFCAAVGTDMSSLIAKPHRQIADENV